MSGGSFDYLDRIDRYEISERENTIRAMADRLRDFPNGRYAARKTEEILALIDAMDALVETLRPVWKAVDRYDSFDDDEEDVARALAEHVRNHPPLVGGEE